MRFQIDTPTLPIFIRAWFDWPTMSLILLQPHRFAITETFIHAHTQLPTKVTVLHGYPAHYAGRPVLNQKWWARGLRKFDRLVRGKSSQWEMTRSLLVAIKKAKAQAVLAEYGPTGAHAAEACRLSGTPLIVHFHGYDASHIETLRAYDERYRQLFEVASALVVVSRLMERVLLNLGASPEKIRFCPYGVDTDFFLGSNPLDAPPLFVAVGRLVEKKAPHLLLLAFSKVLAEFPSARLRIVGEGPLRGVCRDLVHSLRLDHAVTFLGAQSHAVVREELRAARCFVQHSVTALDGDSEGTPVSILEASASGLPVISTHHAGIPEAVIDGVTGHLVAPGDADAMAERLLHFCRMPTAAAQLGAAGRDHILNHYSQGPQLTRLWAIIREATATQKGAHLITTPHQNSAMVSVS